MEEGEARSTGRKRAPICFATSVPSMTSAISTCAPALTAASAKARPRPRAPPVTRMVLFRSCIEFLDLLFRLRLEHAAHARHADVVLVEEFAAAGVGRHVLEQLVVLLEHLPVQAFEAVLVEKAPDVALPALHLAAAPEEHLAVLGVDRRYEAGDVERAAGTEFLLVRDGQAHPLRTRLAPFDPVEIQTLLIRLLKYEPRVGLAHAELGGLVAFGHGV